MVRGGSPIRRAIAVQHTHHGGVDCHTHRRTTRLVDAVVDHTTDHKNASQMKKVARMLAVEMSMFGNASCGYASAGNHETASLNARVSLSDALSGPT